MTTATASTPRRSAGVPARSPWDSLRGADRARWVLVDALGLLVLLALVAAVLRSLYQSPWLAVTVGGFGLTGMGIALLAAWRHWRVGLTAAACVVAWFSLGTLFVMPSAGIAMVVPTLRSLRGLLLAPVTAWRDLLTLQSPIGETANLFAPAGIIALLVGVIGMGISLRTRFPALAWLPAAAGYLAAAALGAGVVYRPILIGAVFLVVVLVWTSYRRAHLRESLTGRSQRMRPVRLVLALATLLAAGGLTWLALPVLQPEAARTTLRQAVQPPIELEQFASPLQAFRGNITKHEDTTLFEVSGLVQGDILRVATMDSYDGLSFRVATTSDDAVESTTFTRVGQWIADDTPGTVGHAGVRVRAYDGVWVPTVGRTTQISFTGDRSVALGENFFYNRGSGTGVTPIGVTEGDAYSLAFIRPERPSDEQIKVASAGRVALPAVEGVPDELRNLAHEWGDGLSSAGEQALALETNLGLGYFSHGQADEVLSLSGHSAARLLTLIATPEEMVGDDEQYATAMALMARELGIPARVVYGYRAGNSPVITGADVGAWTEVHFDEYGWVVFDPTPPRDRTLEDDDAPQPPKPRPHIENPPPPPEDPEPPLPDEELPVGQGEPPVQEETIDWGQIGVWVALTGIPLVTVVVPIALIVGLKLRRRSRRRNAPEMANRVAGAWSELVDRARDLGRSPSASATRSEQAQQLVEDFPKAARKADPIGVSTEADWLVFAPGEPSEQTVREFWEATKKVDRGMRRSVAWPRWFASKFSTKSFRRFREK
ncbi:transglutaminase domain-containing protein [Tessaracoccus rhinocerotis]|uniref:Transglutaminase domain-containing protein n=1 Tax=Tessaracoccus rhinocerotis TaxID=1689449 RepID=A0A553JZH6_9ACTN|nr:transglutaminase-like domain-containing protein [Tessaracoccus rhinocerotis]TRY17843.1 transglutaminase domain-containing protein [Tessaracoccus rhinocerotis]